MIARGIDISAAFILFPLDLDHLNLDFTTLHTWSATSAQMAQVERECDSALVRH